MRANVGRRVAIVVDGEVVSAPRVNPGITGTEFMIYGAFTKAEAQRIAADLSSQP
jgi:preprotein translocase subunit SecD